MTPTPVQVQLEPSWHALLTSEFAQPYFAALVAFIKAERAAGRLIFPPGPDIFRAFALTPVPAVRVVILGQDPYHGPGQAHGLAFSVPAGVPLPPSLQNIYAELRADLGQAPPPSGDLSPWARQGVLLLNATLTVEAHRPASHQNHGWERFTDAAIRGLAEQRQGLVFILWGASAQRKAALIDASRHTILRAPHPSPLSAHRGFFGSRPFSQANAALVRAGLAPIDWCGSASAENATAG